MLKEEERTPTLLEAQAIINSEIDVISPGHPPYREGAALVVLVEIDEALIDAAIADWMTSTGISESLPTEPGSFAGSTKRRNWERYQEIRDDLENRFLKEGFHTYFVLFGPPHGFPEYRSGDLSKTIAVSRYDGSGTVAGRAEACTEIRVFESGTPESCLVYLPALVRDTDPFYRVSVEDIQITMPATYSTNFSGVAVVERHEIVSADASFEIEPAKVALMAVVEDSVDWSRLASVHLGVRSAENEVLYASAVGDLAKFVPTLVRALLFRRITPGRR